jgi:hypothetical protein
MQVTRDTVDALLDAGALQCQYTHGKWYTIRRNGVTKRWKTQPLRIVIPFKCKLRDTGWITEHQFNVDGVINPDWFRINPDGDWL